MDCAGGMARSAADSRNPLRIASKPNDGLVQPPQLYSNRLRLIPVSDTRLNAAIFAFSQQEQRLYAVRAEAR